MLEAAPAPAASSPESTSTSAPEPALPPSADHQRSGLGLRSDDDALLWLVDLLSAYGSTPNAQQDQERYVVLPSSTQPRYLVPVGAGRATSINLRAGQAGVAAQALRALVAPAARLGVLRLFPHRTISFPSGSPDHPTLAEHLARRTGHPHLALSLSMGPPRANRKPILQLTDPEGSLVAYAKVSADAHSDSLVDNEAATLERLAARSDLSLITVPVLLDRFHWKGHHVVLLTSLPTPRQRRQHRLALTEEVVRTIAGLGPEERARGCESRWWATVQDRISATEASAETNAALRRVADAWVQRWGSAGWSFGHWHGDLTPWNAVWHQGRLLVWDWERSGGPVPLGLDVVHNGFQPRLLRQGASVADAVLQATRSEGALLGRLGVTGAELDGLGVAYLIELALRLVEDARSGSLGRFADLLPTVLDTAEAYATETPA